MFARNIRKVPALLIGLVFFSLVQIAGVAVHAQQNSGAFPAAPAVSMSERLPSADEVLNKYIKAVGGESSIRKCSTRIMKGAFELPSMGLTGTAEIDLAAPDKFYSLVRIDQQGDWQQGYDGQVGWSSDPNAGVREFSGEELAQLRRHSEFYHDLEFKDLYPHRQVASKVKVGDRDAWVLEASASDTAPEKFYFDAGTGLLLRHDSVQVTPEERVDVQQYYSDYSEVDGVKLPMFLRHVEPQYAWQVRFSEVTHNLPIEASKFAKPVSQ